MWDRVYEVDTDRALLRLREIASEDSPILARLEPGQIVCRLDTAVHNGQWWAVFADLGQSAYVGYVQFAHLAPLRPVGGGLEPVATDPPVASPPTVPAPPADAFPLPDPGLQDIDRTRTYLSKVFTVVDPDARLRNVDNLLEYERYGPTEDRPAGASNGVFKIIPIGTRVRADEVKLAARSGTRQQPYVHVVDATTGTAIGWTSTVNFDGKFVGETLGSIAPTDDNQHGPHAAWAGGAYLGQVTLVRIVNVEGRIEHITQETLDPLLDMVEAAARDGKRLVINDGFRSYPDQKHLHDGWTERRPGFNLAARPGFSKHQSGVAIDFSVPGGNGNPVYEWLKLHGPSHGWVRTVSNEAWHWEYNPEKAQWAVAASTYMAPNILDDLA